MDASRGWTLARFAGLAWRAFRSSVLICAVAIGAYLIRRGEFNGQEIKFILLNYWRLGLIVFFGVLIGDFWFEHTRRPRVTDEAARGRIGPPNPP